MLLKKEKAKEKPEDDTNSEYSAGEITVSQLDFCRGLELDNMFFLQFFNEASTK